jgi:hypothetical protein
MQRVAEQEYGVLWGTGYGVLDVEARFLRARVDVMAASALGEGSERRRLLRAAAARLRVRRATAPTFMNGRASFIGASVALASGRPEVAVAQLDETIPSLRSVGAVLIAESASYCRGLLGGGQDGRAAMSEAEGVLRGEGVVDIERWLDWSSCGMRRLASCSR